MSIIEAAQTGDIAAVREWLTARGKDLNTGECEEALHVAAFNGHMDVVQLLTEYGVNVNSQRWNGMTPLNAAVQNLNVGVIAYLLDHGADINIPDSNGQTPLHWTIEMEGDTPTSIRSISSFVEMFILRGADVNAKTTKGETPLDWAVDMQHHIAEALIRAHGGRRGTEHDR